MVEGVIIYAVAGVGVWYWGKGTFWSETLEPGSATEGPETDQEKPSDS